MTYMKQGLIVLTRGNVVVNVSRCICQGAFFNHELDKIVFLFIPFLSTQDKEKYKANLVSLGQSLIFKLIFR